uniref:Uncharacterized protein n=1 Tax=Cannabis sativa TaxID=3483 RepID=A0A803Q5K0_CANSA
MKQTCRRVPPSDPNIARVATSGRVRVVEEANQPHVNGDPGVDQGVENPDAESDHEEVASVRKRRIGLGTSTSVRSVTSGWMTPCRKLAGMPKGTLLLMAFEGLDTMNSYGCHSSNALSPPCK